MNLTSFAELAHGAGGTWSAGREGLPPPPEPSGSPSAPALPPSVAVREAFAARTIARLGHDEQQVVALLASSSELDASLQLLLGAVSDGRPVEALRLARAAAAPLAIGRRWGAWEQVLTVAGRAATVLDDQPAQAWVLHELGSRALCLDEVDTAHEMLSQALVLRETEPTSSSTAPTVFPSTTSSA